jgi:hypothetical protein
MSKVQMGGAGWGHPAYRDLDVTRGRDADCLFIVMCDNFHGSILAEKFLNL